MNISQQFAPPFKLISPYFIIGIFVLTFSTFLLFGMDISTAHSLNSSILAWVHLFTWFCDDDNLWGYGTISASCT